jgi:hypothetical protein
MYFLKDEIHQWLLRNRVQANDDLEIEAANQSFFK